MSSNALTLTPINGEPRVEGAHGCATTPVVVEGIA